jgi:hypothetical protein
VSAAQQGHRSSGRRARCRRRGSDRVAAKRADPLPAADAQRIHPSAPPPPHPRPPGPRFFHSTNAFACPSNTTNIFTPEAGSRPAFGAAPDLSVGVLLGGMDRVLWADPATHTLRVQAGMTVRQLLEAATAANMSVPLGTVPAFADLMLGGVLLTGAHGSNYRGKSNLVRSEDAGREAPRARCRPRPSRWPGAGQRAAPLSLSACSLAGAPPPQSSGAAENWAMGPCPTRPRRATSSRR